MPSDGDPTGNYDSIYGHTPTYGQPVTPTAAPEADRSATVRRELAAIGPQPRAGRCRHCAFQFPAGEFAVPFSLAEADAGYCVGCYQRAIGGATRVSKELRKQLIQTLDGLPEAV